MQQIFDFYIYLIEGLFGFLEYDFSFFITILKPVSFFVSLILVFLVVWSFIKLSQIIKLIKGHQISTKEFAQEKYPELQRKALEDWQKILEKGKSLDENERKFAIIEADTLIDKILELAGFHGENLGERLKNVERGDIESLDDIWEAHKIRNRIAHEANFKLSPESAELALLRFEKALKELEYI